ncbi:MAG: hypothetical protein V4750_08700 [Pseudomonadota bacterium]
MFDQLPDRGLLVGHFDAVMNERREERQPRVLESRVPLDEGRNERLQVDARVHQRLDRRLDRVGVERAEREPGRVQAQRCSHRAATRPAAARTR